MSAMTSNDTPGGMSVENTIFSDLARQYQQSSNKQADFYAEILSIFEVNLEEARTETQHAVKKAVPGAFALTVERHLLASFSALDYMRNLVPAATNQLIQFQADWRRHLAKAIDFKENIASVDGRYLLTAFSVVTDRKITLDQAALDALSKTVAEHVSLEVREALRRASELSNSEDKRKSLDKEVRNWLDVLAAIVALMEHPGLKPVVRDPELQKALIAYFGTQGSLALGGAAGNEAYILPLIGCQALIHSPFFHSEQASVAEAAAYLDFDHNGLILSASKAGHDGEAQRLSFALQLTPQYQGDKIVGPKLNVNDRVLIPQRADRVIFQIPNPRVSNQKHWRKLKVIWSASKDRPESLNSLSLDKNDPSHFELDAETGLFSIEIDRNATVMQNGKPVPVFKNFSDEDRVFLPAFQHRTRLDQGILTITLASVEELQAIAPQIKGALLGGIQKLSAALFTPSLTKFLRVVLAAQLRALSSKGASLHLELSGISSRQELAELRVLLNDAGICHISCNREELAQMTSEPGEFLAWPRPLSLESPLAVFLRGQYLLEKLGLKSVYIHDSELDISIHEGDIKGPTSENTLVNQRQAMLLAKAAVPAALMRRDEVSQSWSLALSTESLVALLSFATEYADYAVGLGSLSSREEIYNQLLSLGYCLPPRPGAPSVVVAPAVWVKFDPKVSLAGAGDMNAAVQVAGAFLFTDVSAA